MMQNFCDAFGIWSFELISFLDNNKPWKTKIPSMSKSKPGSTEDSFSSLSALFHLQIFETKNLGLSALYFISLKGMLVLGWEMS